MANDAKKSLIFSQRSSFLGKWEAVTDESAAVPKTAWTRETDWQQSGCAEQIRNDFANVTEMKFTIWVEDLNCASRVRHVAAGFVLGMKLSPGKFPTTFEGVEFGIAATTCYIGTLKAANELFDSIKL